MRKTIYCDKCLRPIKVRGDLVTASLLFEVVSYHEECYAKDLKGVKKFFLDNQPINGFSGNIGVIFITILSIIWLLIAEGGSKFIALLGFMPRIYRLYSYVTIERHIEK